MRTESCGSALQSCDVSLALSATAKTKEVGIIQKSKSGTYWLCRRQEPSHMRLQWSKEVPPWRMRDVIAFLVAQLGHGELVMVVMFISLLGERHWQGIPAIMKGVNNDIIGEISESGKSTGVTCAQCFQFR